MTSRIDAGTEVRFIRGVGLARAQALADLGVGTVFDLLEYFPFRHELIPKSVPIGDLELGKTGTVVGQLKRLRRTGPPSRRRFSGEVEDGTGRCRVRWFNSGYLEGKLHTGDTVRLTGKVEASDDRALLTNPRLCVIHDQEDPFVDDRDRFEPVYHANGAISSRVIARIVLNVLDQADHLVKEFLPPRLCQSRRLQTRKAAILGIHRPIHPKDVALARRRLAFEELFLCQLAVQISRARRSAGSKATPIVVTDRIDERIRKRFPFALTKGQNDAIDEIVTDLAKTAPMNRMLQADVGAGKTAVALYAALAAIANGCQTALIAPTEVLATQHFEKVKRYLHGSRVRIGLLVGSITPTKRVQLRGRLRAGNIDLLIGTHAMLEDDVRFSNLGLVILDEQHKFGVAQRAKLRAKGTAPHALVLSATPIPRTLAMTVFGDLDCSVISGVLPGRRPVHTELVAGGDVARAWARVRKRLDAGEQAYVVYPLVEESQALPLRAAAVEVKRLRNNELRGFSVGLLHGRMKSSDKSEMMRRFREGAVKVLVSTTVIEVGIDVPNATVMVVQHAERYGLSQLHQLRGRIGRGPQESICFLVTDAEGELVRQRLAVLCETNDGFRIAETDLQLRGPGELLGIRQHGLPQLRVADLTKDLQLLEEAREDAADLLRQDPLLKLAEHALLRQAVRQRFGEFIGLFDVA